jgi:hypothetical protein
VHPPQNPIPRSLPRDFGSSPIKIRTWVAESDWKLSLLIRQLRSRGTACEGQCSILFLREHNQKSLGWGVGGGFQTFGYNCTVDFCSLGLDFAVYNVDNWCSWESLFSLNASFHESFTSTHINTHLPAVQFFHTFGGFVQNSDAFFVKVNVWVYNGFFWYGVNYCTFWNILIEIISKNCRAHLLQETYGHSTFGNLRFGL